ncbi:MAG: phage tail protein [Euryarchaeota archaeon]|nr:phage tail protein [Euryarchaeota archaeon]MBU4138764.1 phage tail protein [Euryarchaeota archaeon]
MSITGILEQGKKHDSKIYGVVAGIVTDNKDPDGLGRIKVIIPRISGEDESNWARVISFMAGKERGAFYLPEVDDEVLLAFEYGDINIPYVIGSLWNGKDKPPITNDDGENNIRIIKSRSGHIIRLDDTDGKEKIEIVDKTEKNSIIIDSKENKISIKSEKDIEISAPNGKVTIDAKDIEAKSSASAKIEASSSMDLKASGTLTVKGATVNIN